jgi:hypothetical protein
MALTTDYLYQFSLNLIRKNQAGALASIEWARHWNDASNTYMDDLLGRFQSRSNGKTGMNTGLIENETIETKLDPFTKTDTIVVTGGNGPKPSDFAYLLALRIGADQVIHINKNQIAAVNDNVIDPPSITNGSYYYTPYLNYYSFLPNTVTSATIDYIATPVDVVWGFTFDGSGRQVYNSGTSVQPVWSDSSCREITKRMLVNLGVSFHDSEFTQFGTKVQMQGE